MIVKRRDQTTVIIGSRQQLVNGVHVISGLVIKTHTYDTSPAPHYYHQRVMHRLLQESGVMAPVQDDYESIAALDDPELVITDLARGQGPVDALRIKPFAVVVMVPGDLCWVPSMVPTLDDGSEPWAVLVVDLTINKGTDPRTADILRVVEVVYDDQGAPENLGDVWTAAGPTRSGIHRAMNEYTQKTTERSPQWATDQTSSSSPRSVLCPTA